MVDDRRREQWVHTADILAKLSNGFGMTKNNKPVYPWDCSPFSEDYDKKQAKPKVVSSDELRHLFSGFGR